MEVSDRSIYPNGGMVLDASSYIAAYGLWAIICNLNGSLASSEGDAKA